MSHVSSFAREHKGLLALNALLILVLLIVTFGPVAAAQPAAPRPRGDYTMVSGRALGFTESAIWLVDTANQELMVLRYNRSTKQLAFLGYRNMALDARQSERRGR